MGVNSIFHLQHLQCAPAGVDEVITNQEAITDYSETPWLQPNASTEVVAVEKEIEAPKEPEAPAKEEEKAPEVPAEAPKEEEAAPAPAAEVEVAPEAPAVEVKAKAKK